MAFVRALIVNTEIFSHQVNFLFKEIKNLLEDTYKLCRY